jgi:hypothetical protein
MKTCIHIYLYLERKALNIYRIEKNASNKKFSKELIACFPLIYHGPPTRRRVPHPFNCCMYSLPR